MPKNLLKSIGRRRSSGNALDHAADAAPAEPSSSFRVIERPAKNIQHTFNAPDDRRLGPQRAFNSPLAAIRGGTKGKSADDLGLSANRYVMKGGSNAENRDRALKGDRDSGGTTNSTGSSGYYESSAASARHSSSSTLPSSLDAEREPENDELFSHRAATNFMHQGIPLELDAPLPPPPSFSARAVRAFSFGNNKHNGVDSAAKALPARPSSSLAPGRSPELPRSPTRETPARERGMTTSSYASTAVPSKSVPNLSLGLGLGESSFGNDFEFDNMFGNFGKSRTAKGNEDALPLQPSVPVGVFHRTESEPIFPPQAHSRQAFTPLPNLMKNSSRDTESPYSWDGRASTDNLVSSTLSSPRLDQETPPAVPSHGQGIAPAFLAGSKGAYSRVPDRYSSPSLERSSYDSESDLMEDEKKKQDPGFANRQGQLDHGEVRAKGPPSALKSTSSAPHVIRTVPSQIQASVGASRPRAASPHSEEDGSLWGNESINTTPRAAKLAINALDKNESLFGSSPVEPPSRAVHPGHARSDSGTPKKMTKAQFDYLQRRGANSHDQSEDDAQHEDEYDDDDDIERGKEFTRQRRKQEASMSVYRQQMKKVTGGGPTDLPASIMRPSIERSAGSAPAGIHFGGTGGTPPPESIRGKAANEDDDEDVPLGILQAHGFPSASRPPTSLVGDHQRNQSVAGSVAGGQGNLPPFARRLPMDPYFGAGIVNQANRESLAFGSSAGPAYGGALAGPQQMNLPGGLVGVIASEERAKAARRGSPNPTTGTFNHTPMPQLMPRTMSMGSLSPPRNLIPGTPSMPVLPQISMMGEDPAQQQMQQFMAMQMQMMQTMMAMQQQMGQSPQPLQPTPDYLGVPMGGQRPLSIASNTGFGNMAPNQGRAMTMMHPPSMWDLPQGPQRPTSGLPTNNYTPSIQGLNISGAGPGPGYTPSIAPSERSNIGMPTRYRPVTQGGDGRTQSMASSMTLQALTNQQGSHSRKNSVQMEQSTPPKPTIRIIDKPKGAPSRITSKPLDADEDEDEGWAELAKKRTEKKFSWRRKDKNGAEQHDKEPEPALSELYRNFD